MCELVIERSREKLTVFTQVSFPLVNWDTDGIKMGYKTENGSWETRIEYEGDSKLRIWTLKGVWVIDIAIVGGSVGAGFAKSIYRNKAWQQPLGVEFTYDEEWGD